MANKMSTEKMLQNQRIAIWLILAFVVFITLWFVYSVKTLQTTSMTTSSEAWGTQALKPGRACTRQDSVRYKKGKDASYVHEGREAILYCCKKPGTAQYIWNYMRC